MRLSLRVKWAFFMVGVAVLPLLLLAYRSLTVQRSALAEAEKDLERSIVRATSEDILAILDNAELAANQIGAFYKASELSIEAINSLSKSVVANSEVIMGVAIYNEKGEQIGIQKREGSAFNPPQNLPIPNEGDRPWQVDFGSDGATIHYISPQHENQKLIGYVYSTLEKSILDQSLMNISNKQFLYPDRLLVVDSKMRLVAGAGNVEFARELTTKKNNIDDKVQSREIELSSSFIGNGEALVGTLLTIPEHGWSVVVVRPEAEAFKALRGARKEFSIAAAATSLIAVIVALFLANRTTKPISELVSLTQKYAKREFSFRSYIKTGDELEVLGDSMTLMADSLSASEKEIARRATVEAGLSRYLPEAVATSIAEGKGELKLGGERKQISVLFADVVSFTSFSESAEPELVTSFLNELFGLLSEVVFRHHGLVDKFMGDSIMAVFGAMEESENHAEKALACAEDMHRFVESHNEPWKKKYGFDVRLGIGCASGLAVVGNLGSEKRMEYTAIGDSVNVAARLETLARPGQTLCTAETVKRAGQMFEFRSLGMQPLRGKSELTEIYELAEP